MSKWLIGAALALMLAPSLPAQAQSIGTPGNAPLYPGGPRQGLGPPSLGDSVPDLRLRSDGGGIPGAGPPIGAGGVRGGSFPSAPSRSFRDADRGSYGQGAALGQRCRTARRVCTMARPAALRIGCSCRLPGGGRARGAVVR